MNMPGLIPGLSLDEPVNLSRRRFLASTAVGGAGHRFRPAAGSGRVQAATGATTERGPEVPAFLEIRRTALFACSAPLWKAVRAPTPPWRRIVGEELDADPATFIVEAAPPGEAYVVMDNGMRITGGSMSVRMSYPTMRRLGALAPRHAAAGRRRAARCASWPN